MGRFALVVKVPGGKPELLFLGPIEFNLIVGLSVGGVTGGVIGVIGDNDILLLFDIPTCSLYFIS